MRTLEEVLQVISDRGWYFSISRLPGNPHSSVYIALISETTPAVSLASFQANTNDMIGLLERAIIKAEAVTEGREPPPS